MIRNFEDLEKRVLEGACPQRAVLCGADDLSSLKAFAKAEKKGLLAKVFLVGKREETEKIMKENGIAFASCEMIGTEEDEETAEKAVSLLKSGEADILAKGSLSSAPYIRAVNDPVSGIVPKGEILNSVMMIEGADKDRFIFASGCPLNEEPALPAKLSLIMDTVELACDLGREKVRVAALTTSNEVNPNKQSTVDAFGLSRMRFANCEIEGPLTLADALINDEKGRIVPDYDILFGSEAGMSQLIQRAFRFSQGREFAGILSHTVYPVAITSRVDCVETRYDSLLLALFRAQKKL